MIKKILPKAFIFLVFIVAGILWLISGVGGKLDFSFNAFWPTVIIGIGLAFLVGTFCYNSPGYLYFVGLFCSLGGVFLAAYYMPNKLASLKTLWPLLIGCPGVASLIMFFVRKFSAAHLKALLFFLGLSAALYVANAGIVSWGIMVPAIVILIGIILLAGIIFRKGRSWDMTDDEENYTAYEKDSENRGDDK